MQDQPTPPGMKALNPTVAAALGFFFPGAGHIYCGERKKGVIILIAGILTAFLCGLMNLWAAWASWNLAKEVKFVPIPPNDTSGEFIESDNDNDNDNGGDGDGGGGGGDD